MNVPEGSQFKIEPSLKGNQISWFDHKSRSLAEIGSGLFILFWLGGWSCGEYFAIKSLIENWQKGEWNLFVNLFLLFWLGGWTVGGLFASRMLILIFTPSKPTKLTLLSNHSISFEQGTYQKHTINSDGESTTNIVRSGKRQGLFSGSDIQNLTLDRIGQRQRLYFDYKSQRIEIGKGLAEPEREWLYRVLQDHLAP